MKNVEQNRKNMLSFNFDQFFLLDFENKVEYITEIVQGVSRMSRKLSRRAVKIMYIICYYYVLNYKVDLQKLIKQQNFARNNY